jgi:hypothetical protein
MTFQMPSDMEQFIHDILEREKLPNFLPFLTIEGSLEPTVIDPNFH